MTGRGTPLTLEERERAIRNGRWTIVGGLALAAIGATLTIFGNVGLGLVAVLAGTYGAFLGRRTVQHPPERLREVSGSLRWLATLGAVFLGSGFALFTVAGLSAAGPIDASAAQTVILVMLGAICAYFSWRSFSVWSGIRAIPNLLEPGETAEAHASGALTDQLFAAEIIVATDRRVLAFPARAIGGNRLDWSIPYSEIVSANFGRYDFAVETAHRRTEIGIGLPSEVLALERVIRLRTPGKTLDEGSPAEN